MLVPMAEKSSSLILLAIFLVRMTSSEKAPVNVQTSSIKSPETHDEKYHEHCEQNHITHFFNGSYGVQDILEELLSNKTLTNSIIHKEKRMKRGDCSMSQLYGGSGGSFFQDPCDSDIAGIIINSGGIVDSIQTVYKSNNKDGPVPSKHGGTGGTKHAVILTENDYIIAVVGSYGRTIWCDNCISELGFITLNQKSGMQNMHGPYGLKRGRLLVFVGEIAGFFGRSGQYLDAIGCYYS